MAGFKRKAPSSTISRKRAKSQRLSDLPWKSVSHGYEAGVDVDEGILELEEVDDVEVIYEETEAGRVARFNVRSTLYLRPSVDGEDDPDLVQNVEAGPSTPQPSSPTYLPSQISFDAQTLLSAWHPFDLHPQLNRALYGQQFATPTPIQEQTIPHACVGRDIIGVAETGSGKTLAYGLPILNTLLRRAYAEGPLLPKTRRPLRALILAPTRELALQVSTHLNACLNDYSVTKQEEPDEPSIDSPESATKSGKRKGKGKRKDGLSPAGPKAPPLVSVAAIVGGMSAQKQRRVLERGVDVLVATPGRLWDILEEDGKLAKDIKTLQYLVLDEADRMIETGHFAELENILRLTQRQAQESTTDAEFNAADEDAHSVNDADQTPSNGSAMQTLVFSATLSKDLQRNFKRPHKPRFFKKGDKPASTLDDLLLRLDFRDPEPQVVDISPEGGVVSTLTESKIECLMLDKDAYLYYFLSRYPGRTLVFLSAIDGIRRLLPMLELLGVPAFPLHSQLEQRQRLKNLDRFKTLPNAVLLATDIAARGLDIPSVDHVVHYQIPRSADAYVHRNGRTARAKRSGFSMLMCAPDERRVLRALLASLGRQESDISDVSVDHHFLDKLKQRLQIAKQIDNAHHRVKKTKHDRNWMREAAEAMDLELDSDLASGDDSDGGPSKQKLKAQNVKIAGLKAELKRLLAQPLVARGVSTRYITSGSTPIVDDILSGDYHQGMIGAKNSKAGSDLVAARKERKKKRKDDVVEVPEWTGFGS
ncbi:P-loop containing nucleoside triphosphate hydrolase protein [Amylostereum chailletii]|nr:P-loop containing nucleoside triphosphate hydrolase protein [Amylostereum chailletii]